MTSKMERPADENLPEVYQPVPHHYGNSLPEVVPDSSPEAAQQRYFTETDKYPAYYDNAPKLPHEAPLAPPDYYGHPSPAQQYQQPWTGAEHSVSAVSPNSSVPWQSFPPGGDDQQTFAGSEPVPEKRIWGIRKRLFIIIASILGVVVVAVAIGAGVGAAKAVSHSSDTANAAALVSTTSSAPSSSASASSSASTGTIPTTTTSTHSSTTTSSAKATMTNLNDQTDPSVFQTFAFQGFSEANFTGKSTPVIYDEGFYDLGFKVTSYIWLENQTNCCITFCHNTTLSEGYWCDTRRRNATDSPFPRLSVWCGRGTNTAAQKKCS